MEDFASTALFNLIVLELRKHGMDVSSDDRFDGKTPDTAKRQLLGVAIAELGPSAVLSIGQGIRHIDFHPILAVLGKSRSPNDLLHRWRRLEGYYHGRHRVRLLSSSANSVRLCHFSTTAEPPSAGEDLLIAGLLCALMQLIGVNGLIMTIDDVVVYREGHFDDACKRIDVTSHWDLCWSEPVKLSSAPLSLAQGDDLVARVKGLIVEDPARGWSLKAMAAELQTSSRTLQRRLSGAGSRFQLLLREARVECAARCLLKPAAPLGEVGYLCGFSDQAHFSREFRQRYNISPSQFVDLAAAGAPGELG